ASIDMLIEHNHIHNTGRGIWIDWMAQGTKISGNILYDNTTEDLFSEVNHGPYMVYNNIFLSQIAIRDWSEGGAYLHNFIAGKVSIRKVLGRVTPYHLPHSTRVSGLRKIYLGDNRYMNNIFSAPNNEGEDQLPRDANFYGLHGYKIAGFSNIASGNVYFNGAQPGDSDQNFVVYENEKPTYEISREKGKLHFKLNIDIVPDNKRMLVTTDELGSTIGSEAIFENPDGSQLILNKDISGNNRNSLDPMAGPIEKLSAGESLIEFYFPVTGN
ncbi:MAG: right-handed parallel beta-helix repeat-containing protein, partial [Bacteroidales bacterium]|nr:right-handed parallel beta-helix repeat-containing protein [Bacteroidales bacterium]